MKNIKRPLQVFLCHASGDKPAVRKLYERLVKDGIDAWLDKEKLIPGQNWQIEISKAVRNSDVVIVCLSSQSVTKEGFVQKEIKFALDAADEKPDGTIFIIPARLEECEVPERISKYQWVDLFADDGYKWLLKALQIRSSSVKAVINPKINKVEIHPHKVDVKQEALKENVKSALVLNESVKTAKRDTSLQERESKAKLTSKAGKSLLDEKCAYFSSEYRNSFIGKFVWLFEKTGDLYLTETSLVFSSRNFKLAIPFERITSIETKLLPRWSKPVATAYITIDYIENQAKHTFGLSKNSPVWESNKSIGNWVVIFQKIPSLSKKLKYPLQIPSPSVTRRQVTINMLIALSLMVFGILMIIQTF